ncbi:hypothetical protein AaE_013779 [Aphanomyces astaci]|uniref:Tyrosine-protein kinase ephrin type A/B receptor-like domain-containing protein n=1 Tax=Aphanomyces astaci TaxID=112090 RepID=A0A6A4Z2M6_APHAT|nr:hypothetical protein AaE_013779 [Aphanomyces astaci]
MRWFQKPCEPGYYCVNGVRNPCPTGTFGSTAQLVTPFCSGMCSAGQLTSPMHESSKLPSLKVIGIAGYYCTQASTSATQIMCGDVSVFCPVGSSAPLAVDAGYYSVGATNSTRQVPYSSLGMIVGQALCNVGQFCRGGIAYDCPQGTYGDIPGLTVGQCTGWCAAGFYCPPRSVSATANRYYNNAIAQHLRGNTYVDVPMDTIPSEAKAHACNAHRADLHFDAKTNESAARNERPFG